MSELQLRIVSALVIAPVAILATWLGGWVYALMIAAGCVLAVREWRSVTGAPVNSRNGLISAGLTGLAVLLAYLVSAGAAIVAVAAIAAANAIRRCEGSPLLATGILYVGLPGVAAILLRSGPFGGVATALVFAIVWSTDIGAYFVGRSLGGPKLWPRVSPKKTWSGALGGLVVAMIAAVITLLVFGLHPTLGNVATAALVSAVSQAGDLYESALKRRFGVKDSGNLIPGHGGILDRIDGLVAALAIAALLGWGFNPADSAAGFVLLGR